jgi:receptor protein-tyrosine kinase
MSLVERVSERLEELRKAGVELAGELAYPPAPAPEDRATVPTTIERAVARMGQSGAADGVPVIPVTPAQPADGIQRPAEEVEPRRKEPHLVSLSSLSATAPTAANQSPSRHVEVDFALLKRKGYITPDEPESALANQLRKVKWPLIQACQGKSQRPVQNANRIMVTSSIPGEGKSFVALNLALSIAAERDYTVLLIDADTTRPSLSQLLQVSDAPGLLDLLGTDARAVPNVLLKTNVPKLTIVGAGVRRSHATELLASEAMATLVGELSARYSDRILIFDTPPLLAAPEPAVLASYMGQILVVTEAERTTRDRLKSALATIETCPVVRLVLNKAATATEGYSYAG